MKTERDYSDNRVNYIYDDIETKQEKQKDIMREYGYEIRKQAEIASKRVGRRPYGQAFAEEQLRRARPKRSQNDKRTVRTDGGGYMYRPGRVSGEYGDIKVAAGAGKTHFKLALSKVVNLFETLEERALSDEKLAKRRAIMEKRWSENKQNIITALVLLLLTVSIFFGVYKVFFVVKSVDAGGSEIYTPERITAVSGIELGKNLYSFSATDVENEILFRCPYLKSAEVTRMIPKNVNIYVEDDVPKYCADIWGDNVVLSAGLKVLGKTDSTDGLITLVLPMVNRSVAGKVIEFANAKNERVIRGILEKIDASSVGESGAITLIDLTDEYNIKMEASGLYSLKFGGENDFDLKLRMMYKTITSGSLDKNLPASIDLTTVGEACVRYDF